MLPACEASLLLLPCTYAPLWDLFGWLMKFGRQCAVMFLGPAGRMHVPCARSNCCRIKAPGLHLGRAAWPLIDKFTDCSDGWDTSILKGTSHLADLHCTCRSDGWGITGGNRQCSEVCKASPARLLQGLKGCCLAWMRGRVGGLEGLRGLH